jgi:hypothetical protein
MEREMISAAIRLWELIKYWVKMPYPIKRKKVIHNVDVVPNFSDSIRQYINATPVEMIINP